MSERTSQIRSLIIGCIIIYALGYAAATITFYSLQDESPQDAYERGKIDGQLTDTMKPYVTMEIVPPPESEIVIQIIKDDTLYFRKIKVDTGYILTPIYRVRKTWTLEDSMESWEYEEWLDTSRGWYGWEVSEKLARSWYYGTDSTDTMPAIDSVGYKCTFADTVIGIE